MRKTLVYTGTKPMTYRTRRLVPGDTITCSGPHARAWVATKKFREGRPLAELPPPPADLVAKIAAPAEELTALRTQYFDKLGKRPFHGWSADVLREKIAAA